MPMSYARIAIPDHDIPTAAGLVGLQGGRYFTNAVDTRTNGVDIIANYGWSFTQSSAGPTAPVWKRAIHQTTSSFPGTIGSEGSASTHDRVSRPVDRGEYELRNPAVLRNRAVRHQWTVPVREADVRAVGIANTQCLQANSESRARRLACARNGPGLF